MYNSGTGFTIDFDKSKDLVKKSEKGLMGTFETNRSSDNVVTCDRIFTRHMHRRGLYDITHDLKESPVAKLISVVLSRILSYIVLRQSTVVGLRYLLK